MIREEESLQRLLKKFAAESERTRNVWKEFVKYDTEEDWYLKTNRPEARQMESYMSAITYCMSEVVLEMQGIKSDS